MASGIAMSTMWSGFETMISPWKMKMITSVASSAMIVTGRELRQERLLEPRLTLRLMS